MKPDEVATIMLSVSPFKAALSSENATSETHPQHNHALDIQPDVTGPFPTSLKTSAF